MENSRIRKLFNDAIDNQMKAVQQRSFESGNLAGLESYKDYMNVQKEINLMIPMDVVVCESPDSLPDYECPMCDAVLDDWQIVCDKCGQRLDWSKSGL